MQSKLLADIEGQRTFAVVMQTGDDVMARLTEFAEREQLLAAQFSAIGALSDAAMTYFDWQAKTYRGNPVNEQVEVAALNGDVALGPDGRRVIRIHTLRGRRDGSAIVGHLAGGHIRPTLEIVLTESPAHLRKSYDPKTGLALIRTED